MGKEYRAKEAKLQSRPISEKSLVNIGRLVRACAEIEDLVTLYIVKLARIDEARGVTLLGRTAVSRRLEMAEYMAQVHGAATHDLHKACFDTNFDGVIQCRNTVAHGAYLGVDEDGRYSFLTDVQEKPELGVPMKRVVSLGEDDLSHYADDAETIVRRTEETLKLQSLREKRLEQSLLRHPKAPR